MDPEAPPAPSPTAPPRRAPPQGYRQGLITAITVLLGFSLSFLRYWGFEAPGEWSPRSVTAASAVGLAILMQIFALARSLRFEDDDEAEFATTVRWLLASALVLLVGLALALVFDAGVFGVAGPRVRST